MLTSRITEGENRNLLKSKVC